MALRDPIIEEQHRIPQQISAFQFHLVGDMTLKQFLQLAGGALIALVIYASGLPTAIKWPLILFSFGFGAALAFLPLEDRPLGKWLISFFKSIYSPTVFVWQKAAKVPQYFSPETEAEKKELPTPPTTATTPSTQATQVIPEEKRLEEQESSFLSKIAHLANTVQPSPAQTVAYGVRPVITQKPAGQQPPRRKEKHDVVVPSKGRIKVERKDEGPAKESVQEEVTDVAAGETGPVAPVFGKGTLAGGVQARFSPEASPPMPPTKPNTVVGQVVDSDGKIVEGAILEIKDHEGRPVRALKTNKLGHFIIVTSLANGKYEMTTEKEGLSFEPVTFEAKGEILPPIAIWAKGGSN
ncbi:hypothetical protein IID22_04540 [Patescibacteria group bacterium]|nr:hypothetical protein [Patescibacteria group bacterium]